jgi:hypothetical protein
MATKITPENKDAMRTALFGDREKFLFADMPEPVEPAPVDPRELMAAFRAAFQNYGGLFRPTDAAVILGLNYNTIVSHMNSGSAEFVEAFGAAWITGRWLDHRLANPAKPGRPPRGKRAMLAT